MENFCDAVRFRAPPPPHTAAYKRRLSGFSLVEAAIVLGVVGFVLGGIWYAAAKVMENYRVNKTVEGVFTTARNIQNLISIRDSSAIGNSMSLNGLFPMPSGWLMEGNNAKNPFGGDWDIQNYTSPERFTLRLSGIPKDACSLIVVKVGSSAAMAGSLGNGTMTRPTLGYIAAGSSWTTTTFPVSPQTAASACDQDITVINLGFGYTRIN